MTVCGRGSNGGTSHLTSAEKRSRRASIKKRPGSPDRNKDPQTVTAADGQSNHHQPPERPGEDTDPLLERGAKTSRDYEEEREGGERETKDDSEE